VVPPFGLRVCFFESYPFERHLLIDLPARLAPTESFASRVVLTRSAMYSWQPNLAGSSGPRSRAT